MKLETVAYLVSSIVFGVLVYLLYLLATQFSLSGYSLWCFAGFSWLLCKAISDGVEKGVIKALK